MRLASEPAWCERAFASHLSSSVAIYAIARLRNPEYWDPLDDLDLAGHEAVHPVFSAFGETMTILGGSLFR